MGAPPTPSLPSSGNYYCKGLIGRSEHSSQSVTITVQEPNSTNSLPLEVIVAVVTGIAVVAIVAAVGVLTYLRKRRISGNPEHREMGETLPEEPANPTDPGEAPNLQAENTITYSLLKHPEAPEEET
ncbi:PREDICTED: low affinity immunoglobulin gamma Fc region receptor II-b-like [Galeopterus variegatus]|uniref:low affinity immunoglobulin gamma Fc region receptor II-b-like n=1 Tax=Galeopterus variegatus TaxID=482537 RepID=UPI0004D0867E|nr:PREDICTED: low affinity immunoglobulin gamma Fc region receptor II-b-like [Galeopterus variegatus]